MPERLTIGAVSIPAISTFAMSIFAMTVSRIYYDRMIALAGGIQLVAAVARRVVVECIRMVYEPPGWLHNAWILEDMPLAFASTNLRCRF